MCIRDSPDTLQADAFLKVNSAGNGFVWSTGLSGSGYAQVITGATHFTGLQDTPSTITNNRVLFTKNGNINFIEPTGLALKLTDLTDTPKSITEGKILVGDNAGNLILGDNKSYDVISSSIEEGETSLVAQGFVTGAHLATISQGERISISESSNNIEIAVKPKSFDIAIDGSSSATTTQAQDIISRVRCYAYKSLSPIKLDRDFNYNLSAITDGNRNTSSRPSAHAHHIYPSIIIYFKTPIYINSFTWDGDSAGDTSTKINGQSTSRGVFSPAANPNVETPFISPGVRFDSLGKISSIKLEKKYWRPKIRELKIDYQLTNPASSDKKYVCTSHKFSTSQQALNPTLYLNRGEKYNFNISAKGSPFYIKTETSIGTSNQYNIGVTNDGITGGQVIFDVPLDVPDTLFISSSIHSSATGMLKIPPLDLTQQITDQITGEGISTFVGLSDTPSTFDNDKYLKVTSDGTGIEYASIEFPDSEVTFTGLSGTPGSFTANKFLKVTSDGTGIESVSYTHLTLPTKA